MILSNIALSYILCNLGPLMEGAEIRMSRHNRCGDAPMRPRLIISETYSLSGFRRRTPGPLPFSSMNSTPTNSKARRMAKSLAAVMDVSPSANLAAQAARCPFMRLISSGFRSLRAILRS